MPIYKYLCWCSHCNHCITKIEMLHAIAEFCPNCGISKIASFYSYGSCTHKKQVESFIQFGVMKKPVTFPKEKEECES